MLTHACPNFRQVKAEIVFLLFIISIAVSIFNFQSIRNGEKTTIGIGVGF